MIATIYLPDLLRGAVIFMGGCVVGGGMVILFERARFYQRIDLHQAKWAMYVLALINTLVLGYVSTTLIAHWGEHLSWRWAIGVAIFATKGYFFHLLRSTGIEQERRILYGEPLYPDRAAWLKAGSPERRKHPHGSGRRQPV